jgi:putative ATP-binding cassette transporter
MFFLPERPHLFKSTMRDLLRVSPEARNLADDEIREVLRSLHVESLIDLAGGFDVERAWDDLLGLGEQAALAVARVLLADPQFVFLDRMSIAMDSAKSDQILKLFTEKGIGYLVLGRSIDDLGNFDASLSIAADGSWTWHTTVDTSST